MRYNQYYGIRACEIYTMVTLCLDAAVQAFQYNTIQYNGRHCAMLCVHGLVQCISQYVRH